MQVYKITQIILFDFHICRWYIAIERHRCCKRSWTRWPILFCHFCPALSRLLFWLQLPDQSEAIRSLTDVWHTRPCHFPNKFSNTFDGNRCPMRMDRSSMLLFANPLCLHLTYQADRPRILKLKTVQIEHQIKIVLTSQITSWRQDLFK